MIPILKTCLEIRSFVFATNPNIYYLGYDPSDPFVKFESGIILLYVTDLIQLSYQLRSFVAFYLKIHPVI